MIFFHFDFLSSLCEDEQVFAGTSVYELTLPILSACVCMFGAVILWYLSLCTYLAYSLSLCVSIWGCDSLILSLTDAQISSKGSKLVYPHFLCDLWGK